jgi:hypothetical protein
MKILRALVPPRSGSAARAGSATATGTGPLELTEAQLHQVGGGGGKIGVQTGGNTSAGALSSMTNGPNGGPAPHPDGGKGGVSGSMG